MNDAARQPVARPLFVATIVAGSFLLFLVQPMVARMALPRLGGAPNVWNSAMVLYQALLLAGYAYAHRISRLTIARQGAVHLGLLALFTVMLPVALFNLSAPARGWEVIWVPALFFLTIGPVFFVISAQAPLMQRWYAAHPNAGEPWMLYAASNFGSFTGLLAYPLLAEPLLSLRHQSIAWSLGYGLLILFVALCLYVRRSAWIAAEPETRPPADVEPSSRRRFLHWIVLAAVPSGLMLSTTTHLTTDIFAMPLLWVIPLGLYLLSFVIAFADRRDFAWAMTLFAPPVILLCGGLAMMSRHSGSLTFVLAGLILLFSVATALHSRLYDLRPPTQRLTEFYLAMSIGGALGGVFTAILAPVVFDWVWEHPILVLAAAMLIPLPTYFRWHETLDLKPRTSRFVGLAILAVGLVASLSLLGLSGEKGMGTARVFLTIAITGIGLLLTRWRWMFLAVLTMLMLGHGGVSTIKASLSGERVRSYFGIYTVRDYPQSKLRMLIHGSTLHGEQFTDPARRLVPTTYYGPGSGAGLALSAAPHLFPDQARIGVVGLGTGTLACWRKPGQDWTFFEIDPAVLAMSRNGTFTYLRDCAPGASVVLGDARLTLAEQNRGAFDVLVIDAFSSDAIPLHLITEEAFKVYAKAIGPKGVLLIHISNRYIDLEAPLAAIASKLKLAARARDDNPSDRVTYSPSLWVALSRDPSRLEALESEQPDAPWKDLQPAADRAWTDDYASILPYIRWNKLLGSP